MTSVNSKPRFSAVISLLLAGAFLSFESVRLMQDCRWKTEDIGFFIALCAVEITAGYIFAAANKQKMTDFLFVSGALLLTLHAGVTNTTLDWICNFLIAGGVISFLARNKKFNTFFPFAAALGAGLILALSLPEYVRVFSFFCSMFLTGTLIISAAGFRHLRWIFLPLILIQVILFPTGQSKGKLLRAYRDTHDAAVSALPSSLLTENDEKNLSVLQVTRSKYLLEITPWKILPGVGSVTGIETNSFPPVGMKLDDIQKTFDIVSVEILPEWSESAIGNLLEKLSQMVDPENGIMIFPYSVLKLMPQNKDFITVPGSEGRRIAAGKFDGKKITCEDLEKRLQNRISSLKMEDFMIPGVFPALFNKNPEKISSVPKKENGNQHSLLFWITLGTVWFLFRTIAARKENFSAFLAETDNKCSTALIVLAGFCIYSESRMYACFPETFFMIGVIFTLPFFGKKGKLEKVMLLSSIVLPWLFMDPEPGVFLQAVIYAAVLICCISSGMTTAKIMLETNSGRKQTIFASLTGIFFGGLLFHFFFIPGNPVPVLAAASILRAGNLLRE